jgi:hypothetical protein
MCWVNLIRVAVVGCLLFGSGVLAAGPQTPPTTAESSTVLYVSPQGKDKFSGTLAQINADQTDGPLGTLAGARDKVRELKSSGQLDGTVTVYLRGGKYLLDQPVIFTAEDSAPVTYTSYPGEQAIIDGGRQITGWKPTKVNEHDAWVADLPWVRSGRWYFHELFVNGKRCTRARLPKGNEVFKTAGPALEWQVTHSNMGSITRAFHCQPNQLSDHWTNPTDVDLVLLHYWTEERSSIASYDPATNILIMSRVPTQPMGEDSRHPDARFYVENVFEALRDPGDWYLDRPSGKIYYVPQPGEEMEHAEAIAPRVSQLIKLAGKPEDQSDVQFIHFKNLTFANADWNQPNTSASGIGRPDLMFASAGQAASDLPGAIQFTGARSCSIEDCRLEHLGMYAIELGDGCNGNRIIGNDMTDLGAGGVRINGSGAAGPLTNRTGNNRITDNHIHAGGRIFASACGILSMNSAGNTISHNEIDDLFYTGISCGWVWGYAESASHDNLIEKNHIHNIGQGVLSDMGGIYTLGNQAGTIIRGNVIHDVTTAAYGAGGIYPDEGSAGLVIEDNVCYDVGSEPLMPHYCRENIVRNNIFAFGGEGVAELGKAGDRNSYTLERNILISNGQPIYRGGYASKLEDLPFRADLNLIWDASGQTPMLGKNAMEDTRTFSLKQWQELGQDRHSIFVDPHFKDLAHRDFTLLPDSPARVLGFHPIELSDVGPRPAGSRD